MLQNKQTAELGADDKGEPLFVDIDPSHDHVYFRIGKHRVRVSLHDLYSFTFLVADEETQEKLMPVRQTQVMHTTKVHAVALKKDMKKGEIMKVRCHTDIPMTVVEGLKGLLDKKAQAQIHTN